MSQPGTPNPGRSLGLFAGVFVLAIVGGIGIGVVSVLLNPSSVAMPESEAQQDAPDAPRVPANADFGSVDLGGVTLVDQAGTPRDGSLFEGEVTVLSFFFTRCQGPCPMIIRAMAGVQDDTAGTGLRLASISVDGGHDTPAVLAAYADGQGADAARWAFLSAPPEQVKALTERTLGFTIREAPGADARLMETDPGFDPSAPNILHPNSLLLVGPDRGIVGAYVSTDPVEVERLKNDAAALLNAG